MCVCQRMMKDRADGMGEKCPFPLTGFEPVPPGYAPIVLPITPQGQARLVSVETNTSDTVCVWGGGGGGCGVWCVCHNEKCQTNGKHNTRHFSAAVSTAC